jgi:hypothetical protein
MKSSANLILRPRTECQPIAPRRIYQNRALFGFLVWRDIKIRYKQTILGGLWVAFQPLTAMLVFALFFNPMVGIQTNGPQYALFSLSRLPHWTFFFANSVSMSSNGLARNWGLVSKIYFPLVFMPLASIGALVLYLVMELPLGPGVGPMSGMIGFRHSMPGGSSDWATVALARETRLFYLWRNCSSFGAWGGASRTSSKSKPESHLKYLVITGGVLRTSLFMSVPTP